MYIEPLHHFLLYIELSNIVLRSAPERHCYLKMTSLRQLPANYILIIVLYNLRRALNMI
jgi:hypothetical protein